MRIDIVNEEGLFVVYDRLESSRNWTGLEFTTIAAAFNYCRDLYGRNHEIYIFVEENDLYICSTSDDLFPT